MCVVLALGTLPATAKGQVLSFSVRSELVVFSATAVDDKGRPVTDLRREDFRIWDEGRAQQIVHFYGGKGLPARVLVLLDASGSMGDKRVASSREAAKQLLLALSPEDQVAVAGFDSRYWGVVAFTTDREAVRKGLDTITPFGSTALHDALDKAAHDIATWGEGRRAVVVLTDGIDTSSQKTAEEVIARSRALDVPIYADLGRLAARRPELAVVPGREGSRAGGRGGRDARAATRASPGAPRSASARSRAWCSPPSRSPPSSSISTASGGTPHRGPLRIAASWCARPARA